MGVYEQPQESSRNAPRAISIEVGADGLPVRLTIAAYAMRCPVEVLAEQIVAEVRAGHARQVEHLVRRFDQIAPGLTPPADGALQAAEQLHERTLRASRAAMDRADDLRRVVQQIIDS